MVNYHTGIINGHRGKMVGISDSSVAIQVSSQSVPSIPAWFFERDWLPHRSTLSRFLAALNQSAVEFLRVRFLKDLLARPLEKEEKPGGLWDRQGTLARL